MNSKGIGSAEEPRGKTGMMYHIGLRKSDVKKDAIALLPGDTDRVARISKFFDGRRELNSHREYHSYGGYLGKRYVIAMSTGIGAPAMAIAIEELARLGVKTMIRIGTCGSISKDMDIGNLVIADSAVRLDGTTPHYVMDGYPAAATPEVTIALKDAAHKLKKHFVVGTTASSDSFYVGQSRKGYGGYLPEHSATLMRKLASANVKCFEMEASALFTVGRIYGIKTGALFAVVANRTNGRFEADAGVEDAIETVVKAIKSGDV